MTADARRSRGRAAAAGALALVCSGAALAADLASPVPVRLTLGYSSQIFVDVESEEARSILKILSAKILERHFPGGTSTNLIFADDASIQKAFLENRVDMAGITSDDYVRLAGRTPFQPIFTSTNGVGPYHQVVLLVRRDAGIRSLNGLRGKKLTLSTDQSRTIHLTWLETLLMRDAVRKPEDFFSSIKEFRRPSQAILPVFFEQADACLTTQQAFDVVSELNPQVSRDLVVLERSPDIASGVLVLRTGLEPRVKASLIEVLEKLPADPEGDQILRLFRMNRLIPWRPEYAAGVAALLREHESLAKGLEKRR